MTQRFCTSVGRMRSVSEKNERTLMKVRGRDALTMVDPEDIEAAASVRVVRPKSQAKVSPKTTFAGGNRRSLVAWHD